MTAHRPPDSFVPKPRFLSFTRNVTSLPFAVDRIRQVVGGGVRVWSKETGLGPILYTKFNDYNEFYTFLLVDKQLRQNTAKEHVRAIKHFWENANQHHIAHITVSDIREYLSFYVKKKTRKTYNNVLCSLRRYFRDYLKLSHLVGSFEFADIDYIPPIAPTDQEVRIFHAHLPTLRLKAMFLLLATSGRRPHEVLELQRQDIDWNSRMLMPTKSNPTKKVYFSFFNEECERALKEYLETRTDDDPRVFTTNINHMDEAFKKVSSRISVKITPKDLRVWFACKMADLGVQDRYVDAFCGRVPKSVLARHYTDYSPQRLKRIYDRANLKVLS